MSEAGLVLVAVAPGLLWLWFFVRLDRIRPSSRRWIALTVLLGVISTFPVALVEWGALRGLAEAAPDAEVRLATTAIVMLGVVGPVEEAGKFLAVRLGVYRSLHFEEPLDGLVYGAAASLGFASLENLLYVLVWGPEVMLLRAPFSTLAHVVFGSVWGYGLGLRRGGRGAWVVWGSLAAAAALHGAFNILIFTPLPWSGFALAIIGGAGVYLLFTWGQRISPFRHRSNLALVSCDHCRELVTARSRYCRFCGVRRRGKAPASLICGNCNRDVRRDAHFCTGCGDWLLT